MFGKEYALHILLCEGLRTDMYLCHVGYER